MANLRQLGTSGLVTLTHSAPGGENFTCALAIQSDGKILLAGVIDHAMSVTRLNTDGSVDTSFGTSGYTTFSGGWLNYGKAIAVEPDGKIVVAGESDNFGSNVDWLVARRRVHAAGLRGQAEDDPHRGGSRGP